MAEEKLFFEDVNEGDEAPAVSHELTRTDLVMYAGASGDFNQMHHDEVKAKEAGLPSVNTCLICHAAIATDKPRIQQITAMADKGVDLAWQRVYGYPQAAHVKFNHAPHIRASVDCATCHGDLSKQTVAERSVDHSMGFCVNCHKSKNAPNDCLTCHY